ncbi:choline transporter-like protein [Plasmopara halstedii]|uniref:Choline transporter-like protein n=1 Tax=Plasmopara halstedii TaxID=4781 RepID=A0A0P1AFG2_PLAHL|nr:choline transporter-like protein [Plasmopara halstedii]CEG39151.1 choline transporter-like protein [Plasmopara halstedii]|eukprot:XP_024575520.1 choline transporter-like protein [Plasmopara halstedii]
MGSNELSERKPLLSPGTRTAAALSPSTGSTSAFLRRSIHNGQEPKRQCTDILFLGCFATYWIGMIALAITALSHESSSTFAQEIESGVDFQGQTCGKHHFVYFPDFPKNPDFGVCVEHCPQTTGEHITLHLPVESHKRVNGSHEMQQVHFTSYATHRWAYVCAPAKVNSDQVMIRQLQDTLGRFVGALGNCWQVLLIGTAISMSTAAIYLVLLRYCGCISVFMSTLAIETTLAYSSYRLLRTASDSQSYENDPVMLSSLQISAVVMCCAAILFLLFAIINMSRLLLAGAFISHAARALSQFKRLFILPFISYVLLLLLFGWGLFVTVSLFGAGETSTRIATISATSPTSIQVVIESFQVSTKLRWLFLFHLWGMYWSVNFILAIGEMITAIVISLWYFAPENRITGFKEFEMTDPVSYAAQLTIKYHLGTLALSSSSVALVEHIRTFFLYLENKNEYDANAITKFAAKCCCCCSYCFRYCLKYICKEAVYVSAIQCTDFYTSGKLAYTLISSNLIRVGALSRIGHASVLLGKLIVCTTTCLIAWILLSDAPSPVLPLVAVMLFSYSVAHAFLTIYETTINMLLMCFTLDENLHGGRGNSIHASAPLIQSINDHLRPKWQTVL